MKGKNEETLLDDLAKFYKEQYSADRISLVIQTKTSDNLKELRKWVEESFGTIPNKNLGKQDFSQIAQNGNKESPATATLPLPFEGNEHEMVVLNSYTDLNNIMISFCFERDVMRFQNKQSIDLIIGLLSH